MVNSGQGSIHPSKEVQMQTQSREIGSPSKKVAAAADGSVSPAALKNAKGDLGHCAE